MHIAQMLKQMLDNQIVYDKRTGNLRPYRLIVVVMPPFESQAISLGKAAERVNSSYVNINLELSRRLLELTQRQRPLRVQRLLEDIIGNTDDRVVFLDRIEILFDVSLKLDPLRCLQGLARNRTVIAVWNGSFENNYLVYAEPGHPEYRRYQKNDFLVVIGTEGNRSY